MAGNKTLRGINGTSSRFFVYEDNAKYRIPFVGEVGIEPQPGTTDTLEAFEGTLQNARPPTPELLTVNLASFNAVARWARICREASNAGRPLNFEFESRPGVEVKAYSVGDILVNGAVSIAAGKVADLAHDGKDIAGFKGPEYSDLAIGDVLEFASDPNNTGLVRAAIVDFKADKIIIEGVGGAAVDIADNLNVLRVIVPQIRYAQFLANIQGVGGGTWAAGANVTSVMNLACVELLKDPIAVF